MLDTVAVSLTPRQGQIYWLVFRRAPAARRWRRSLTTTAPLQPAEIEADRRLHQTTPPAHPDQPDDGGMGAVASGIAGSEAGATLDAAITGLGAGGPGTPAASAAAESGTQAAFDGSVTQLASSSRTPHFARVSGRNRRRPGRRVIDPTACATGR